MPQDHFHKIRLKKGERRSIKPVIFPITRIKESDDVGLIIAGTDGDAVTVLLKPEVLSGFAMAALGVLHESAHRSKPGPPEVRARLIPVDGLRVLSTDEAPPGHSVLELSIGTAQLRFVAPSEMFRQGLEEAAASPAPNRTKQ